MKHLKYIQFAILALCLFALSSCTTTKKATEETEAVRWPDFLRDWAAEFEINDSQRLSLINLIDSVYYFLEDSTQSVEAHSDQVCRMLDQMADVIANDSVFEFTLMMRATESNFWWQASNDDRVYQCDCSAESISRFVEWQTIYSPDVELMGYTIIPISWQAPWHFANIIFTMVEDDEVPLATFVITNYENFQLDSVQITFYDSLDNVLDVVHENDVYVDSSNVSNGVKTVVMPPKYMMLALSQSLFVEVSYKTTEGWYYMKGGPGATFVEQINDCPRLKKVLDQIMLSRER